MFSIRKILIDTKNNIKKWFLSIYKAIPPRGLPPPKPIDNQAVSAEESREVVRDTDARTNHNHLQFHFNNRISPETLFANPAVRSDIIRYDSSLSIAASYKTFCSAFFFLRSLISFSLKTGGFPSKT